MLISYYTADLSLFSHTPFAVFLVLRHISFFVFLPELKDEEAKEKCMLELLHSLPDANYYTIAFMIEHLARYCNVFQ